MSLAAADTAVEPRRRRYPYAVAAPLYLGLAVWLWWGVWSTHPSSTGSCGCGDPSLFTWFLAWAAYALAHGHNPFFSTVLFHPSGINLLSNTSVLAVGVLLSPVTWLSGPITTLNVALTLMPAASALSAFWLIRRWVTFTPAAFVGGLLFGFSPFVLADLSVAHLMTATLVLVPLWVGALDELLVRQRRSPVWMGVWLGAVGTMEFFVSTEMAVIVAMSTVLSLIMLAGYGLLMNRGALRRHLRRALIGLGVGATVIGVLLAYPVWFALDGPAHLTGLVWPKIPYYGGFVVKSFFSAPTKPSHLIELGGYFGHPLPSPAFVGWSLLGVLVGGLVLFWRDLRLWFFAGLIFLTAALSLGRGLHYRRSWVPWDLFVHLSVLENVIEQRFVLITYLAIAVMLAIVLDRLRHTVGPNREGRRRRPARAAHSPRARRLVGTLRWLLAVGVCVGALLPVALPLVPYLPYHTRSIVLPEWFARVGAHLAPGAVILAYPAPFSGIQSSMTWQAVDAMDYAQAGGGGPQGTPARAGSEKPGYDVVAQLGFGFTGPPSGTPKQIAAVRAVLRAWRVTIVVIPRPRASGPLFTGDDPAYAAAFMTATLGRKPLIEDRAWVWYHVDRLGPPLTVPPAVLGTCDLSHPAKDHPPMDAVTDCVYQASVP